MPCDCPIGIRVAANLDAEHRTDRTRLETQEVELLTYQQTLTAVIAVVAIIVSMVSLRRTSRVHDQQLRLQKKQEELTDLQLELVRKQAEARAVAATTSAPPEKADVRVNLERVGKGHKFIITNWGRVPARNVTFDLDVESEDHSPLVRGDYDQKIPIPELAPGSRIPLIAAVTMGMPLAFPARWSWRNPDGSVDTRKSLLGI